MALALVVVIGPAFGQLAAIAQGAVAECARGQSQQLVWIAGKGGHCLNLLAREDPARAESSLGLLGDLRVLTT